MFSPWQCPLPLNEYTNSQVTVYANSGRWVGMMSCSLADAIRLYYQVLQDGQEIFIFPAQLNPNNFANE